MLYYFTASDKQAQVHFLEKYSRGIDLDYLYYEYAIK